MNADLHPCEPSPYLVFMPTYAPETEAVENAPNKRPHGREPQTAIADRITKYGYLSRIRPWSYMDAIDSVLNIRPDVDLVVADARSTESMRKHLTLHQRSSQNLDSPGYSLALFPEKESQWKALNKIIELHDNPAVKYFIYTSSDIVWTMDWVAEAEKEFLADPSLQIVFPCVNSGDPNLPNQVATGPRDLPLEEAPYQDAARAPVLNAYVFICRMDFLRAYGGYPNIFRNCFTESFLHYMAEAIGGKMRLMPRGWCYHHGAVDQWSGAGGLYNHTGELAKFTKIMDQVQEARCAERSYMTKAFLQSLLYEQPVTSSEQAVA